MLYFPASVSLKRDRVAHEVAPVSAQQSATKDNDEGTNGAEKAIDLTLPTASSTVPGSDGISLSPSLCAQPLLVCRHQVC